MSWDEYDNDVIYNKGERVNITGFIHVPEIFNSNDKELLVDKSYSNVVNTRTVYEEKILKLVKEKAKGNKKEISKDEAEKILKQSQNQDVANKDKNYKEINKLFIENDLMEIDKNESGDWAAVVLQKDA